MYVELVPNRNSPPAVLLRESYREGGKVKKRTLANFSSLSPERIRVLQKVFRGELDYLAGEEATAGPVFGLLFTLNRIAEELGISRALGRSRQARLALFLVLARLDHRGSRLSTVRWARQHAVAEVLGLDPFDEDHLYAALDQLADRQEEVEARLFRHYLTRQGPPPALFLYDVTSSYLEGEQNEWADYGYNRDGKKGKKQIVIGLLTDGEGEPLAVRVFRGNTADPATLTEPIAALRDRFSVQEVILVGDRGMIKTRGKEALRLEGWHYITALTDPQIRSLLKRQTIQLGLFEEKVVEVEADGLRLILRKNEAEARKATHRLEDKLARLTDKLQARNEKVAGSRHCDPEAGMAQLNGWISRHRLSAFVTIHLEGPILRLEVDEAKKAEALQLAGCYVIETTVPARLADAETIHERYRDLALVERDFRMMKTGALEVRPIFVRKGGRTCGHVFVCMLALKLQRELERRLWPVFATTNERPHTVTVSDALSALNRLCINYYRVQEDLTVPMIPAPDPEQKAILDALGIQIPKTPQKPRIVDRS